MAASLLVGCPGDDDDDDDTAADDDTTASDDDTTAGDDDTTAGDDDTTAGDDDSADVDPPLADLAIGCPDTQADVYVWPDYMSPWNDDVLGQPVTCYEDEAFDVLELADRLADAGIEGVDPWSGARTYLIAYRTTRWEGEEGVGTARVYLPDTLIQGGPRPVVVVGHRTVGLADTCTPSFDARWADAMALVWVGRGFSVIAPDLAGMGNEGTPGFRHTADTAHSTIDAARALRQAVADGSLAPGAVYLGIGQGGGAALGAHALTPGYGEDEVLAAAAFAPDWPVGTDGLKETLAAADTTWFGTPEDVKFVVQLYADGDNFGGPYGATAYYDPFYAEALAEHVAYECFDDQVWNIPQTAASYADTIESGFLATALACLDGQPECGPPGEDFVTRLQDGIVPVDTAGGPILLVQGMLDETILPEATACVAEKLTGETATVQACTDAAAAHVDAVPRAMPFVFDWVTAAIEGDPLPACAESDLPPCP